MDANPDPLLDRTVPSAMIMRVTEAVHRLAGLSRDASTDRACEALTAVEAAFDNKFVTWCTVQGGAWLRAASALHWQARLERALLQRHVTLDPAGAEDAAAIMAESVSRASLDLLTTAVAGLCSSSRTSALAICDVILHLNHD